MNNSGKHLITNLLKTGSIISFALIIAAFIAACSTPTVSSDDFDGKSSSSEKIEKEGDLSSSSNTSNGKEVNGSSSSKKKAESSSSENQPESSNGSADEVEPSSSSVTLATPCKTETEDNCEYGELKDNRDGQTYKTVKIGAQWWMAENLNYEIENSWCGGGSGETKGNCATYGRLYTWATVIGKSENECGYAHKCNLGADNEQGVCPDGWHVPTYDEWGILFAAVGGEFTAGRKLKAQNGWKAYDDITNEDSFGFAALPAGGLSYFDDVGFYGAGNNALFWSATQEDENYAYVMNLYFNADFAILGYLTKDFGFSVRCVKD